MNEPIEISFRPSKSTILKLVKVLCVSILADGVFFAMTAQANPPDWIFLIGAISSFLLIILFTYLLVLTISLRLTINSEIVSMTGSLLHKSIRISEIKSVKVDSFPGRIVVRGEARKPMLIVPLTWFSVLDRNVLVDVFQHLGATTTSRI